jgi:cell division control protein 6
VIIVQLLNSNISSVQNIFYNYIQKQGVFKDKNALTSSFIPSNIQHRENEIKQLSLMIAPMLKGFQTSNIFIYGKCGTGKTMSSRFVLNQLESAAKEHKTHPLKSIYVNCKMKKVADTEYRLLTQFLKELGENVPDTGLPTDVLYRRFFDRIENGNTSLIIILDEIDALYRKIGDEFLYNLTRINTELKKNHITIVGITNDISFKDNLDARVRSSLSEEDIIFKPYDAVQLKDILMMRSTKGFVDGAINEDVISKCAALAAQEHGDARRALDLLKVAGEIAERLGDSIITEKHVDMAEEKIDMDRIYEIIKLQPKQSQIVLYCIIKMTKKQNDNKKWVDKRVLTGDVFDEYVKICNNTNMKVLTLRRVSDLIKELDMFGIIDTRVISKGRYGRTKEIFLTINENMVEKTEKQLESHIF